MGKIVQRVKISVNARGRGTSRKRSQGKTSRTSRKRRR